MPTGPCGINCDVCRLNTLSICATCGPGKSPEAMEKMTAQEKIMGKACPILQCASSKKISHCTRDCDDFPCSLFKDGPYPFSRGYLQMQERRRRLEIAGDKGWVRGKVKVPAEYWAALVTRDAREISSRALVSQMAPKGWIVPFLNRNLLVDRETRCIFKEQEGTWEFVDNPLLELLCLVYLLNAGPEFLSRERVGALDLKTAHYFKGPHKINAASLLARYGKDAEGFKAAAESLGGASISMGDAAYRFLPFPKVPLYYVLWLGDDEFQANLSILFDRSIEYHLKADAILGLVDLMNHLMLHGPEEHP